VALEHHEVEVEEVVQEVEEVHRAEAVLEVMHPIVKEVTLIS
jgi:hypothetical protein